MPVHKYKYIHSQISDTLIVPLVLFLFCLSSSVSLCKVKEAGCEEQVRKEEAEEEEGEARDDNEEESENEVIKKEEKEKDNESMKPRKNVHDRAHLYSDALFYT